MITHYVQTMTHSRQKSPASLHCTKVLCSIKKQAKEDKDILVSVDSVFYQDDMVMAA